MKNESSIQKGNREILMAIANGLLRGNMTIVAMPGVLPIGWSGVVIEPTLKSVEEFMVT